MRVNHRSTRPPKKRVYLWEYSALGLACLIAIPSAANADKAETLLGNEPIHQAVRIIIDDSSLQRTKLIPRKQGLNLPASLTTPQPDTSIKNSSLSKLELLNSGTSSNSSLLSEALNKRLDHISPTFHVDITVPGVKKLSPTARTHEIKEQIKDTLKKIGIDLNNPDINIGLNSIDPSIFDKVQKIKTDFEKNISKKIKHTKTAVDKNAIEQRAKANVDTDTIQKKVTETVDVNAIKKSVSEAVDVNAIKKKASEDVSLKLKEMKSKAIASLDNAKKLIMAGTANAFDIMGKKFSSKKAAFDKETDSNLHKLNYESQRRLGGYYYKGIFGIQCIGICINGNPKLIPLKTKADTSFANSKAMEKAEAQITTNKSQNLNKIAKAFAQASQNVINIDINPNQKTDPGGTAPPASDTKGDPTTRKSTFSTLGDLAPPQLTSSSQNSGTDELDISGLLKLNVTTNDAVNASIGDNTIAEEMIAAVGYISGHKDNISGVVVEKVEANGLVNAAIGEASKSIIEVADIDGNLKSVIHENAYANGVVNAAIGYNSYAYMGIGGLYGDISSNTHANIVANEAVNAAIGVDTKAVTMIGMFKPTSASHGMNLDVKAPNTVNAAIGHKSSAKTLIGNVTGELDGIVSHKVRATNVVNAAIGEKSDSTIIIGNIYGNMSGHYSTDINVSGATSASIGSNTRSTIAIGNIGPKANLSGTGNINVKTDAITAAAIGYKTSSTVSVGNVIAPIHGNTKINITTGALTAAAIGSHSDTKISIGDVTNTIGGSLNSTISTGNVTAFALGADGYANAYIGTITEPVHGNAYINIDTGDIFVGSLGYKNGAETHIGHVEKQVAGDLNINVSVGDIRNFSFGIGSGDKPLTSRISIGSILTEQTANNEPTNVDVKRGSINAISFGLTVDIPVLGTFFIGEEGCRDIGDIGSEGCGNSANEIVIKHE